MRYTITRDNAERDLRALRGALSGFHPGVSSSIIPALQELADSIEEQVKPKVTEPIEFGSVVRTKTEGLFVRLGGAMGLPWGSGGALRSWDQLDVVEVLRVGIGEPPPLTDEEIDKQAAEAQRIIHAVTSVAAGEIIRPDHQFAAYYDEMNRLDVANAQTEAYTKGAEDFAAKVRREITALRSKVVTGPEKRTCDDLLALVGVLQGLS